MNHAGSLARLVDQQSGALPLYHGCPQRSVVLYANGQKQGYNVTWNEMNGVLGSMLHYKAILGWGYSRLLRWIPVWNMPQVQDHWLSQPPDLQSSTVLRLPLYNGTGLLLKKSLIKHHQTNKQTNGWEYDHVEMKCMMFQATIDEFCYESCLWSLKKERNTSTHHLRCKRI